MFSMHAGPTDFESPDELLHHAGMYGILPAQSSTEARGESPQLPRQVPLKSLSFQVEVCDSSARAVVTQEFVNQDANALDITYVFPVVPSVAVCGFKASFGGIEVSGCVKDKAQARQDFLNAQSRGDRGALLEQKGSDLMQLSIGRLAGFEAVRVEITLAMDVRTAPARGESGLLRLALPAVVGERYPLASSLPAAERQRDEEDALACAAPSDCANVDGQRSTFVDVRL